LDCPEEVAVLVQDRPEGLLLPKHAGHEGLHLTDLKLRLLKTICHEDLVEVLEVHEVEVVQLVHQPLGTKGGQGGPGNQLGLLLQSQLHDLLKGRIHDLLRGRRVRESPHTPPVLPVADVGLSLVNQDFPFLLVQLKKGNF